MKEALLTIGLAIWTTTTYSQGTVVFNNVNNPAGLNAPVFESDRLTPLSGLQFMAELLGGPSTNALTLISTTGFLTGGYFNAGVQTINTVAPGRLAWVDVRVWNVASGASFSQAQTSDLPDSWWESSAFTVQTGRSGVNPTAAGVLTGLGNSPVFLNGAAVPEPSTLGLEIVGGCISLFLRRRRNGASQLPPQQRRLDDRIRD